VSGGTQSARAVVRSAVIAAAGLLAAANAQAEPTCISAYEQTQTLRKDGKPAAAKAQALVCAREACPALLARDCTKWLSELEVMVPTVVLDPRSPSGAARTDVRVKLDGAPFADRIDGKALAVEPGPHTFAFEADGAAPVERAVLVREGDKLARITVTLGADAARPVPLGVWVFGGAAVVALGTSALFVVDGFAKKSDLDACKPRCAASDVDAMSSSFTVADVALGAGVVAGAAALYLYLARPAASSTTTGARVQAVPFASPRPGGGALGVLARF
jgi:hypothetical protein